MWSGSRSYENIDHAGYARTGREVLAQTTVSESFVGKKAACLLELQSRRRDLLIFGPKSARKECPSGIRYYSIEDDHAADHHKGATEPHRAARWLGVMRRFLDAGQISPAAYE